MRKIGSELIERSAAVLSSEDTDRKKSVNEVDDSIVANDARAENSGTSFPRTEVDSSLILLESELVSGGRCHAIISVWTELLKRRRKEMMRKISGSKKGMRCQIVRTHFPLSSSSALSGN